MPSIFHFLHTEFKGKISVDFLFIYLFLFLLSFIFQK